MRVKNQGTTKVTALPMPDPQVDAGKLAEVQQHYLGRYFRPKAEVEAYQARFQTRTSPPTTVRWEQADSPYELPTRR